MDGCCRALSEVRWPFTQTYKGEDEIILDAFAQCLQNPSLKNMLLVLVPRHPERFNSVASLSKSRGFIVSKRSENNVADKIQNLISDREITIGDTQVIIGDTMGELLLLFGASDIAFVGGSLVPNGGHNFIEPAAWQLPLLSGEHVFNFSEVARLLQEAKALTLVASAAELALQVESLAINDAERRACGAAALKVANDNRGALARALNVIESYL